MMMMQGGKFVNQNTIAAGAHHPLNMTTYTQSPFNNGNYSNSLGKSPHEPKYRNNQFLVDDGEDEMGGLGP